MELVSEAIAFAVKAALPRETVPAVALLVLVVDTPVRVVDAISSQLEPPPLEVPAVRVPSAV